jgi:hypothetical protein
MGPSIRPHRITRAAAIASGIATEFHRFRRIVAREPEVIRVLLSQE